MSADVLVQAPARPSHLFLLFHGVGASAEDLVPLGQLLADAFADAVVASIEGPDASDLGRGRQWFSVVGITEESRPARVAATVPRFIDTVAAWQHRHGLGAQETTLVGFSQGAIMALASSRLAQPPAGRVVSLSGRFDALPTAPAPTVRTHFLHGLSDPVIAASHADSGARRLQSLGDAVTLDMLPGLGHGVSAQTGHLLLQRLQKTPAR